MKVRVLIQRAILSARDSGFCIRSLYRPPVIFVSSRPKRRDPGSLASPFVGRGRASGAGEGQLRRDHLVAPHSSASLRSARKFVEAQQRSR
jgi:hypothetical protein